MYTYTLKVVCYLAALSSLLLSLFPFKAIEVSADFDTLTLTLHVPTSLRQKIYNAFHTEISSSVVR